MEYMSSLDPQDPSCMNASDQMSCAAMTELAKKEAQSNGYHLKFLIDNPVCDRYHSLADRGTEYMLQANGIVSKNICFNPSVMVKSGEWDQQLGLLLPRNQPEFDVQTRPR